MARKRDLQQIDATARMFGFDRHEFGDYVEACNAAGVAGTANDRGDFSWQELLELAEEFRKQ
jgi:hypothetical protein